MIRLSAWVVPLALTALAASWSQDADFFRWRRQVVVIGGESGTTMGTVTADPAILEAIGVHATLTGDGDRDASATIEFRTPSGSGPWTQGVDMLRIRPDMAAETRNEELAGSVWGLAPGTEYDIRVTMTDPDGGSGQQTIQVTTRSLPPDDPAAPDVVNVSNASELSSAISSAAPGDVITLADGTYVGDFLLSADGTAANPIYIRGTSRTGTIIDGTATYGFSLRGDYQVIENLTITGISTGLILDGENLTVRDLLVTGVDVGISIDTNTNLAFTIYDNVFEGDNAWPDISSATWDDEGIKVNGQGHSIFHNTLSGFGDALGLDRFGAVDNISIEFMRNEVLWSGDDGIELDDGFRNVLAYHNRITNSATLCSIQHNSDTGGPVYCFQNVGVNQARRPFKLNDSPSGFYLLNNTTLKTEGADEWIWSQFNNGDIQNGFILNNIIVSVGAGTTRSLAFEAPSGLLDFNYNGYLPDGDFWLGPLGSYGSYALSQSGSSTYDNNGPGILSSPVFEVANALGSDYTTEVTPQSVELDPDSDAVDGGTPIRLVTPASDADLGAHELGTPHPLYGARHPLGWAELSNSDLRSECPANGFGGSGYNFTDFCNGVTEAWNGGAFDPGRNRLVIWGGGHADYSGNEIYALDLDTDTMARLNDPGVPVASSGQPESLVGGTQPNSRHTYDGVAYVDHLDAMMILGGSRAVSGFFSDGVWFFHFATMTWEQMSPTLDGIGIAVPGVMASYDPVTDLVFVHDTANLYTYDYSTDTFDQVSSTQGVDFHCTSVLDPVRREFMVFGGGEEWLFDISGSAPYTRTTLSSTGGSAVVNDSSPGLAYDPVGGTVIAWAGGDSVYSFNADTEVWTQITFSGGPGAAISAGTFGRFDYSPADDLFVTYNDVDDNGFVLRLDPDR